MSDGREEELLYSVWDMLSVRRGSPAKGRWPAGRGSGQELGKVVWAADTDPKFITRWMQQKPLKGRAHQKQRTGSGWNPEENQHFRMKEVKKDNEGEAKERWSQRMALGKTKQNMEPRRGQV